MESHLTRSDLWRQQYRRRPYLRSADKEQVDQRLRDVMSNMTRLTEKGQIGPLPLGPEGAYWFEMFTHLLEEYNSRGGIPRDVLDADTIPKATYPDIPKASTAMSRIQFPSGKPFLVKFMKRQYADSFVMNGALRVAPASFYSDTSLNKAIRDDELSLTACYPKDEITITVRDQKTGISKGVIKPTSDLKMCTMSETDYYVLCMSRGVDLRLFDDFESDCCVIIRKVGRFVHHIKMAAAKQLCGWSFFHKPVDYVDPYNVKLAHRLDPYFEKHFRYWYQREYRFVWLPPHRLVPPLKPIMLNLGPLGNIAEYVKL